MSPSFNGKYIWGLIGTAQQGPSGSYRAQTETLPGVDGERVYRMGRGPVKWTVSGWLGSATLRGTVGLVQAGVALEDGKLYAFVDNSGNRFPNCRLVNFRTASQYLGVTGPGNEPGVIVMVQGDVIWESPDFSTRANLGWGIVPGFPTLDFSGGES